MTLDELEARVDAHLSTTEAHATHVPTLAADARTTALDAARFAAELGGALWKP